MKRIPLTLFALAIFGCASQFSEAPSQAPSQAQLRQEQAREAYTAYMQSEIGKSLSTTEPATTEPVTISPPSELSELFEPASTLISIPSIPSILPIPSLAASTPTYAPEQPTLSESFKGYFVESITDQLLPQAFAVPSVYQLSLVFLLFVVLLLGTVIAKWFYLDRRANKADIRIRNEAMHAQGLAPPDAKELGRKSENNPNPAAPAVERRKSLIKASALVNASASASAPINANQHTKAKQ